MAYSVPMGAWVSVEEFIPAGRQVRSKELRRNARHEYPEQKYNMLFVDYRNSE